MNKRIARGLAISIAVVLVALPVLFLFAPASTVPGTGGFERSLYSPMVIALGEPWARVVFSLVWFVLAFLAVWWISHTRRRANSEPRNDTLGG